MPIEALALLRLKTLQTTARVDRLDDAVIVHTGQSFAVEPEQLAEALEALVGESSLAQHDDLRGVFFLPDVAAPKGRSYDAVIDEVGEGGVWAAPALESYGSAPDFGALLGNMLAQLPPSLLSAASSAAHGDRGALDAVSAQVQALLGSSPQLQQLAGQLGGMLGQPTPGASAEPGSELAALEEMFAGLGGGQAAEASLHQLASHMQAELAADPAKFEQLAQQLLGKTGDKDDE
ncbi:MAG: hypothetical protein RLZZ450_261 [Pseudomonadota bacterium]|jgi:hypothetical protein